jgi:hypothetical protein
MFNFTPQDIPAYLSTIIISTVIATFASWWVLKRVGFLPKEIE